jgi:hypothetical protein
VEVVQNEDFLVTKEIFEGKGIIYVCGRQTFGSNTILWKDAMCMEEMESNQIQILYLHKDLQLEADIILSQSGAFNYKLTC